MSAESSLVSMHCIRPMAYFADYHILDQRSQTYNAFFPLTLCNRLITPYPLSTTVITPHLYYPSFDGQFTSVSLHMTVTHSFRENFKQPSFSEPCRTRHKSFPQGAWTIILVLLKRIRFSISLPSPTPSNPDHTGHGCDDKGYADTTGEKESGIFFESLIRNDTDGVHIIHDVVRIQ